MSFDIFVLCFRKGEKAKFPKQLVEQHFGHYVSHREPKCLTLAFEGTPCSSLYCEEEDLVSGFSINRPVDVPEFYDALFDVLRAERLVLLVPGECPPLVGSPETAAQLPPDMIESLGAPVVLTAPGEIREWIAKA